MLNNRIRKRTHKISKSYDLSANLMISSPMSNIKTEKISKDIKNLKRSKMKIMPISLADIEKTRKQKLSLMTTEDLIKMTSTKNINDEELLMNSKNIEIPKYIYRNMRLKLPDISNSKPIFFNSNKLKVITERNSNRRNIRNFSVLKSFSRFIDSDKKCYDPHTKGNSRKNEQYIRSRSLLRNSQLASNELPQIREKPRICGSSMENNQIIKFKIGRAHV